MSTQPKPFVFVIMPFSTEFEDVYLAGIKPACERAGAYAERVDEQIFRERILQRVYNQIAKADIIVADMTGRNANVFYETGYAHALGKNVVLITRDQEDIPFDLKDFPHIVYQGRIALLLQQLEKHIRHFIAHPENTAHVPVNTVEVQVNDTPIRDTPAVRVEIPPGSNAISLAIDVHNSAVRELRLLRCQVGLVTPRHFRRARMNDQPMHTVALSANETLHYLSDIIELLPGSWRKLSIAPAVSEGTVGPDMSTTFAVRVFTDNGFFDYPFRVETVRRPRAQ
jgi:hypothetical protein